MNPNIIPGNIMRMMDAGAKRNNEEIIIDYLVSEKGSVTLTALQEQLLERWNFADDLMRQDRHKSNEVARMIANRYDISIATAFRDMESARSVYGTTRKSNKNYLLALHIDRIMDACKIAQRTGKLHLLPKLYDSLTKAIAALPEDKKASTTPAAIIFQISQQNITQLTGYQMTETDARNAAMDLLAGEQIDFTDIDGDGTEDEGNE